MATRRAKKRTLRILEGLYEKALGRVTGQVLEREDALTAEEPMDFLWEEVEDRHAMRVMHLGQLIGALQASVAVPLRRETRVEVVRAAPETLEARVNDRIERQEDWVVSSIQVQDIEDGMLLAMLVLVRDVPDAPRHRAGDLGGARA